MVEVTGHEEESLAVFTIIGSPPPLLLPASLALLLGPGENCPESAVSPGTAGSARSL